jgi:hypothetical protein
VGENTGLLTFHHDVAGTIDEFGIEEAQLDLDSAYMEEYLGIAPFPETECSLVSNPRDRWRWAVGKTLGQEILNENHVGGIPSPLHGAEFRRPNCLDRDGPTSISARCADHRLRAAYQ